METGKGRGERNDFQGNNMSNDGNRESNVKLDETQSSCVRSNLYVLFHLKIVAFISWRGLRSDFFLSVNAFHRNIEQCASCSGAKPAQVGLGSAAAQAAR